MKKITLLFIALLAGVVATAQTNLLSNGDFEQGMVTWFGNAFNVVEDGGNSFNLSDNEISGNTFDVNISHPVELTAGVTYTFSFDAATSAEDVSRTMIAGIGLNEGSFAAATEVVTVTSELQTFTFELTPPEGSANSRALFDLGGDAGVLVIDNVSVVLEGSTGGGEIGFPVDFELGSSAYDILGFEGADSAVEGNPDASGINTSATVLRSTKTDGAQFFAGTFLNLDIPVDFSESGVVTIDTYSPKDDIPVRVALENQTTGNQIFVDVNTTVINEWETLTFDFTSQVNPSIDYNRIVVFFEFIVDLPGDGSTYFADNFIVGEGSEPNIPLVAAPTPPEREPDAVFSIFSDAYTDQPDVVFGAFDVGTTAITTLDIDGDNFQQVILTQPDPQFLLVDWGTTVDNTEMTHFHMDYWIDTPLSAGLIANPLWSNHVGDAGETSSFGLTNPVSTFGEWVSIDVPLTDFDFGNNSNSQQRDALRQFVLTVAGAENGTRTIFLDNIYLHNNTTLSTEEFTATDLTVFPNPSINGVWNIETRSQTMTTVQIFDIAGRQVTALAPNASTVTIDASKFGTGVYFANVTTQNGVQSIKLVKQ